MIHLIFSAIRKSWPVILCLMMSLTAYPQFSAVKNYTADDGLPSSRIYSMKQDTAGNLWFATENGISVFDGYNFRNMAKSEGLPSNSVIKLYRDFKNRIWFLTYQGEAGYFRKDSIVNLPVFQDDSVMSQVLFDHIYVGDKDSVILSHFYGGIVSILGRKTRIDGVVNIKMRNIYNYTFFFKETKKGILTGFINLDPGNDSIFRNRHPDFTYIPFNYYHYPKNFLQKNIEKIDSNRYVISMGPVLLSYDRGVVRYLKTFDHEIIFINCDSHHNLWVSEEFSGVYMFPSCNTDEEPIVFLPHNTVSDLLEDKEGSYWFSTTENGVFYVPSIEFVSYNEDYLGIKNDVILKILPFDNHLFFSTGNKGMYKALVGGRSLSIDRNFSLEGETVSNINDMLLATDHSLWIPCAQYFNYSLNGRKLDFNLDFTVSGYGIAQLANGSIIMGTSGGYIIIRNGRITNWSKSWKFVYKTFAFCQIPDSVLLIGCINGLYRIEGKNCRLYNPDNSVLTSRISDITYKNSILAVGTFDFGLAIITPEKTIYLNRDQGLASNRIKAVYVEGNRVWAGTNHGLSEIITNYSSDSSYLIYNYTIWDGLPSNEINDIELYNDEIWLGTDKGIVRFNPAKLNMSSPNPVVVLNNVMINESSIDLLNRKPEFAYYENNISLGFRYKSFKNPERAKYKYKLQGLENEWLKTDNTSVRFPKLAYGTYNFLVKGSIDGFHWSEPVSYKFTVGKRFTETLFFKIMTILILLLTVVGAFLVYSTAVKNRERLKRQVILAEQKAARSQMNPHFIFNSLNSIQNFILDKDVKNANRYLSRFSSLMRRYLELSKTNYISLRDELESLKIYLELEKLRFDDHFSYRIDMDPKLNDDQVSIPSMIIQPLLENAIWHGIMPKKEKGIIRLKIGIMNPAKLSIVVEDNGIGRTKSEHFARKRKHHKPTGIINISERLELLNKLNKSDNSIRFVDLFDENGIACGTRVELILEV